MPTLTLDNNTLDFTPGETLLEVARRAGIEIPTLCHLDGHPAQTSCSVCVVKVNGGTRFRPACATPAAEGMVVESETDEVRQARRTALELLLSDHLGDCLAPCESVCPAHLDVSGMLRHLAAGDLSQAAAVAHARLPFPAVLGRICPAPCEKACRRAQRDSAVAIRACEQVVGDAALAAPALPACQPATGKRVAIVGAGPAGLTAAYLLLQAGHACVLFDGRAHAGGLLRDIAPEILSPAILDAEIQPILRLGAELRLNTRLGEEITLAALCREFDAVLLATGKMSADELARLGLTGTIDKETGQTTLPGVFAAGTMVTHSRQAVRAIAAGHDAAIAIGQYLAGATVTGAGHPFSVHIGRLRGEEMARFMHGVNPADRQPRDTAESGYTTGEARGEAERCFHCDCASRDRCRLLRYAAQYGASTNRYKDERREYTRELTHPDITFEPGKCINCGLCVQLAGEAHETLGMAFIGRGFTVRVAVPFDEALAAGLYTVARQCAAACPTGALALRQER